MKKIVSIKLVLLTILCFGETVFSQSSKPRLTNNELNVEIIRLKNLCLGVKQNNFNELDNKSKFLVEAISPLLSKHGFLEVAVRGNAIIITDEKNRVMLISEFIKIIDESGFTLEELSSRSISSDETISKVIIETKYLLPIIYCYGFASERHSSRPIWVDEQGYIFADIIWRFLPVLPEEAKISFEDDTLEYLFSNKMAVVATPKRIELIKKITALFDQPFLVEKPNE